MSSNCLVNTPISCPGWKIDIFFGAIIMHLKCNEVHLCLCIFWLNDVLMMYNYYYYHYYCCSMYLGSKDLLTLMGVTSLPPGVRRSRDRQSAYVIDHTSSINAPVSKVVRVFPAEFALLMTVRQRTTDSGFLFTVNDMLGYVLWRSGVSYTGGQNCRHTLILLAKKIALYVLTTRISILKWHQFRCKTKRHISTVVNSCVICTFVNS